MPKFSEYKKDDEVVISFVFLHHHRPSWPMVKIYMIFSGLE
jgi:hypothetical protein